MEQDMIRVKNAWETQVKINADVQQELTEIRLAVQNIQNFLKLLDDDVRNGFSLTLDLSVELAYLRTELRAGLNALLKGELSPSLVEANIVIENVKDQLGEKDFETTIYSHEIGYFYRLSRALALGVEPESQALLLYINYPLVKVSNVHYLFKIKDVGHIHDNKL